MTSDLQREIDDAGARLRIGYPWWLRPFLMRGVVGITLGRSIFIRAGAMSERLVRHELAHVRQAACLGLPRFLWRYIAEYIALRRRGASSAEAYARISFEVEACAAEEPPSS